MATNTTTVRATTSDDRMALARRLRESGDAFVRELTRFDDAVWAAEPAPGRWSPAQVAEHVAAVERGSVRLLAEQLAGATPGERATSDELSTEQRSATDEQVEKRLLDRSQRREAPPLSQPRGRWATRDALVADFSEVRRQAVSFAEGSAPMRGMVTPHPVVGPLDLYGWLLFLAAHSERHLEQLREIAGGR